MPALTATRLRVRVRQTWCAVSDPSRAATTYNCGERCPSDAQRLCYCSAS